MKLVEDVFEIAESFLKNSRYVDIDYKQIDRVAEELTANDKPIFPIPVVEDPLKAIILELIAASINYCYWYGRHDIRPRNSSSTTMYQLLMDSFINYESSSSIAYLFLYLDNFAKKLAMNRFPLLEERIKHLKELEENAINFCIKIKNSHHDGTGGIELSSLLEEMVKEFPGFASDIFLKRASLFFIQLNRRFGWFNNELNFLHVPADYQIPKMLEHYKCIYYSPSLKQKIITNQLIQKNSLEECEIRAATIIAIKKLCELTNWNVAEIDTFFFTKRHEVANPFHLCVTTDY